MRQNKFIVTKDHLIIIAASNEVGDELWAGNLEYRRFSPDIKTTNTIGFLLSGSVNSFMNTSDDGENWVHYKSADSPLMLIRKNFTNFGIVSTSNNTIFGSILEKDMDFSGLGGMILSQNMNDTEKERYTSSTDTINVENKCKVHEKRNTQTFDYVYMSDLDINIIPDTEIEIEVE